MASTPAPVVLAGGLGGLLSAGWRGGGILVGIFREDMTNGFGDKLCKGDQRRVSLLKSLKVFPR